MTLLYEGAREFNLKLWLVLVDFEKAFDSVEHPSLWTALAQYDIPGSYIALLQSLYAAQIAKVFTDVESRSFPIARGVKQGDPTSALLFIAVLDTIMGTLKKRWLYLNQRRKGVGYGIVVDDPSDPLTNLRFADDLLLVAQSRADAVKMLDALRVEAKKYGLNVHMGKTKLLTNCEERLRCVRVGGDDINILAEGESEKYLGRKLTLHNYHEAELNHRISNAWAGFNQFRKELCCRKFDIKLRLWLFESIVTSRALYGCAAWTLTAEMNKALQSTQRRMLRLVISPSSHRNGRECTLEAWVQWIRSTTHQVEEIMRKLKIRSWVQQAHDRKVGFATVTYLRDDARWSKRLLSWMPIGCRRIGRPCRRWYDDAR